MDSSIKQQHKQRDISLDIICGIFIIHMILRHIMIFTGLDDSLWYEWGSKLLFFFMPWFFFKNGMFFHPRQDNRDLLKQDCKRLLRPFIIWSIIGECIRFVDVALSEHAGMWQWYAASLKTIFLNGKVVGNGPLWFLLSLFLVRILFNYVARHKRLVIPIMVTSVFIPMACWKFDYNQVPFISHTLAGLFFFSCGYYLKDRQRNRHCIAISGIFIFILTLISSSIIAMAYNQVEYGNIYTSCIIRSVAAIILINNLLPPPAAAKIIQWQPCKLFASIGRDSMPYYVIHWPLLLIMRIILVRILGVSDPMTIFLWMLAACVLLLPVIGSVLKRKSSLLS